MTLPAKGIAVTLYRSEVEIVEAQLRRARIALLDHRNPAEAHAAIDEAWAVAADIDEPIPLTATLGVLRLDAKTIEQLQSHGLETIGDVKRLGYPAIKRLPRIGAARARSVKRAMAAIGVPLPRALRRCSRTGRFI